MIKDYKRMYIEEQGEKEFYKNMKDYYKKLLDISTGQIDYYKGQVEYYEQDYKKMKRLSDIGFWCGIASVVFIIAFTILKEILGVV